MRALDVLSAALVGAVVVTGCGNTQGANELGGDPNVPLGTTVGSTITPIGSITVGSSSVSVPATATLTSSSGGVVTFHVAADLSSAPQALKSYYDMLPSSVKTGSYGVATDVKLHITSEGIQDYFNKDQAAHTIVKYDAQVGDKYELTKSDGNTITRTVTARSSTDDYSYGFLLIKTITVEQDSRIPGIKKFRIRANHRFGIVSFEIVADDDSTAGTQVTSSAT